MIRRLATLCIVAYQKTLSPDHGLVRIFFPQGACCYYPSCSEYTKQAIQKYGLVKGVAKGAWRIARCHPFATPRVDKP